MKKFISKILPDKLKNEQGFILPTLLSFVVVAMVLVGALVVVINTNISVVSDNIQSQQAFNIAEAGVNYYLWHLSHNPTDYKDGQTTPTTPDPNLGYGPYVHNYIDANGDDEGTYTLWINPQGSGSTIVTVRSIGKVTNSNAVRTIQAQIGAASFASYGVVSDSALWFGPNETADGPVFSNAGIEMDGPSDDTVSSANTTYVPPDGLHSPNYANGQSHPGVWCDTSVTSPVNCNTRDKSDWQYPQPQIDFNQVSGSLCTLKKVAFSSDPSTASLATQSNACSQTPNTRTAAYLPQRNTNGSFSLSRGYLIQLNNNGTYDLYQVNGETDTAATYTSALTRSLVASGITIPSSGVIFAEDNVWVRTNPTFHGRLTIAAGRLAQSGNNADIVIADNVLYSTKNGSDSLGMVAEGDILIAPYAPPASGSFNFEVDGALLSESGNVEYPLTYRSNQNRCTRGWVSPNQTLTFYGSAAMRQDWTWNWQSSGSCGDMVKDTSNNLWYSGIEHTTTSFDRNLQYAPPPSYPVTGSYDILSWREVLTQP